MEKIHRRLFELHNSYSNELYPDGFDKQSIVNPILNDNLYRYENISENFEIEIMNRTYSNLSFNDDDVLFQYNNFKKSFLQVDIFDDNNLQANNIYSVNIPLQLNTYHYNQGELLNVSDMKTVFQITDPNDFTINKSFNKLYYIYLKTNLYNKIYAKFLFRNAKNGVTLLLKNMEGDFIIENYNSMIFNLIQINNLNRNFKFENIQDGKLKLYAI